MKFMFSISVTPKFVRFSFIFIYTFKICYNFIIYNVAVNLQLQIFSFKKCVFKIAPSKNSLIFSFNLFFIRIIRRTFKVISSLSNHFLLMYLHCFKSTCGYYFSYTPKIEPSDTTAKQV